MNINEYKQLMFFYLFDINTSRWNYAAVDSDGGLHVYKMKPLIVEKSDPDYNSEIWTPREEIDDPHGTSDYDVVCSMPVESGVDWTKTLIKL